MSRRRRKVRGQSPVAVGTAIALVFGIALALAVPLVGIFAVGALVVPISVLFGGPGVFGVAVGATIYHVLAGASSATTAAAAVGYLAFAAAGHGLWQAARVETPWLTGGRRWPFTFAGVVATAGLLHAATVGWAATALSLGAFVSVVPVRVVATLVPAIVLGPPLYAVGTRLLNRPWPPGDEPVGDAGRRGRLRVAAPAVVAVGWLGAGLALSTLATNLGGIGDTTRQVGAVLPEWLAAVVLAVVEYGTWVQVLGGGVALALVALALWPRSPRGEWSEQVEPRPERAARRGTGGSDSGSRYRLSRRDAILALGALGIGTSAGQRILDGSRPPTPTLEGLTAVADAIYPSTVTPTAEFVERYVTGRSGVDPTYLEGVEAAVHTLDRHARITHGGGLTDISAAECEAVLRELGVNSALADPDGGTASQIRHYVVDELLFALFTTPVGGRLVGIENPPGYPGGHEAYQRAPTEVPR